MARIVYYFTASIILTFLLVVSSFISSDNNVLTNVGLGHNITDSSLDVKLNNNPFWDLIFGTAGVLVLVTLGATIAASFFTSARLENYIVLPFILGGEIFTGVFIDVVFLAQSFPNYIRLPLTLLATIFLVGYITSLVEYFRGNI
ncbi:hypothetical protein M0R04_14585 [Candidatus Dojkabacteria bacterium]|jgi:hypothetical protein|nr:hypothetical protein [Candidatus Dojkabacteria bacterium]